MPVKRARGRPKRADRDAARFAAALAPPPPELNPVRQPPLITLSPVSIGTVTDDDIGLTPCDAAQRRAEDCVRAAAAAKLRAELLAEAEPDEAADHNAHVVNRAIMAELVRITARRS